VGLRLDDDATVWFVDPRRFGCLVPVTGDLTHALTHDLGPDALLTPLSPAALQIALRGRRALKTALLDQRRLAGLGNIQVTEILFDALLLPTRAAASLSHEELASLAPAIPRVLRRTVAQADADEVTYVTADRTQNPFLIYGRPGAPCPVCDDAIHRGTVGGRATFWCPTCQR